MHLSEFKAWFEGFTEEMKGPPNESQWKKIKAQVKDISADYTPAPIFVDRYVHPWRRYWGYDYVASVDSGGGQAALMSEYQKAATLTVDRTDWVEAGRAQYRAA